MRPLVIAVGNPFRRDDGVAWLVADELGSDVEADVARTDGEPTRLLDLWADRPLVIVIDAVHDDGPAGRVHRLDPGDVRPGSPASTHGGGVHEALRLGASLDRLPGRCVLIGISGTDFGNGPGCTRAVEAAVPQVVEVIRGLLAGEPPGQVRR